MRAHLRIKSIQNIFTIISRVFEEVAEVRKIYIQSINMKAQKL
jgi:hypothetical protein